MIWCVEDDANIREIEVYALNSTGMEAGGFESGDELWRALERETPELILLDVMLPGEDGVSILRRLRADERYRDIPVIMATAKGTGFVVCAVFTLPSAPTMQSALPWSAVIRRMPFSLMIASYSLPTHLSTASTAFTAASKTPVWPTISQLA